MRRRPSYQYAYALVLIAWAVAIAISLTGCVVPGSQLDLNMRAAGKQCQAGDMAGCEAWTNLEALTPAGVATRSNGAAPIYAVGPRFGMGWVTPAAVNPIQPGPIGQIPALNWGY